VSGRDEAMLNNLETISLCKPRRRLLIHGGAAVGLRGAAAAAAWRRRVAPLAREGGRGGNAKAPPLFAKRMRRSLRILPSAERNGNKQGCSPPNFLGSIRGGDMSFIQD